MMIDISRRAPQCSPDTQKDFIACYGSSWYFIDYLLLIVTGVTGLWAGQIIEKRKDAFIAADVLRYNRYRSSDRDVRSLR